MIILCWSEKLLTRKCVFQLKKYKHNSVSKSIHSDDRNFSAFGLVK